MTTLRFRNVDADPGDAVRTWPVEGVQAALERGSLSDYRRLVTAIRDDPWGDVARRVERVLTYSRPYGATAILEEAIRRHRNRAEAAAKDEVADRLRAALARSGLSQAQFASRLGTSASRMSTYLKATVTPSASLLVRAEWLAATRSACGGDS